MNRLLVGMLLLPFLLWSMEQGDPSEQIFDDEEAQVRVLAAIRANDMAPLEAMMPTFRAPHNRSETSDLRPVKTEQEVGESWREDVERLHAVAHEKGLLGDNVSVKRYGIYTARGSWLDMDAEDGGKSQRYKPLIYRFDIFTDSERLSVVYIIMMRPSGVRLSSPIAENNLSNKEWVFLTSWARTFGKKEDDDHRAFGLISRMPTIDLARIVLRSLRDSESGMWDMVSADNKRMLIIRQGEDERLTCEITPLRATSEPTEAP